MSWEFLIVLAFFIGILVYRFYFSMISNPKLNELIHEYYENENLKITSIRKSTINEKFRYRETNDLYEITTLGMSIFYKSGESYFRVIEFVDKTGKEFQKYVEIQTQRQLIDKVIEFDSYDI